MMNEPRSTQPGIVVSRNGVRPRAAAPVVRKKDRLDILADRIIAGRVAPLIEERNQLRQQSAGNVQQQQRLGDAYDQRVSSLRDDANLDLGAAVAQAAKLRGYSDDQIREYQDWSRGLVAPTNGGTGDVIAQQSAEGVRDANSAAFDSVGSEIAARGQHLNDWLAKQRTANRAQTGELVYQERQRRAAAERDVASRIAQEKARRPELRYEILQKERDYQLQKTAADRAFQLNNLQRQDALNQAAADFALQSGRLTNDAASLAQKNQKQYSHYGFGIPKSLDKSIEDVHSAVYAKMVYDEQKNELGETVKVLVPNKNRRWRTTVQALESYGVRRVPAIYLATKWMADRLRIHGDRSPIVIYKMLRSEYGVSDAVARRVFRMAGLNWNKRLEQKYLRQ